MRWSDPLPTVAGAFAVAVGLYLLVVLAFRIGERRTVAELAPFDLAAIIAIGAIVGGTATGRNSITVGVTAVPACCSRPPWSPDCDAYPAREGSSTRPPSSWSTGASCSRRACAAPA